MAEMPKKIEAESEQQKAPQKAASSALHRGPGFEVNWEKGPSMSFKITSIIKDSFKPYSPPYYFNPKYLTPSQQIQAWEMLIFRGIVPEMCYAPQDMHHGVNAIRKNDIVWVVGGFRDGQGKILTQKKRMEQINKLKALWKVGEEDYELALGLKLQIAQRSKMR